MKYAIVIHKANGNYSAHAPDIDGCIVTGKTVAETAANMKEALEFHFEAMNEDGEVIPEPETAVEYVDVDVQSPAKPRHKAKAKAS